MVDITSVFSIDPDCDCELYDYILPVNYGWVSEPINDEEGDR